MGTLGDDGGVLETCLMSGSRGESTAMENILDNAVIARSWSSPTVAKGAAGAGLERASARARAALVAASIEEVLGTGQSCGKNSTVLATRSARVFGIYTL